MGTDIHPFQAAAGPVGGGRADTRDEQRTEVRVPCVAFTVFKR
jgi:hypothetical protein